MQVDFFGFSILPAGKTEQFPQREYLAFLWLEFPSVKLSVHPKPNNKLWLITRRCCSVTAAFSINFNAPIASCSTGHFFILSTKLLPHMLTLDLGWIHMFTLVKSASVPSSFSWSTAVATLTTLDLRVEFPRWFPEGEIDTVSNILMLFSRINNLPKGVHRRVLLEENRSVVHWWIGVPFSDFLKLSNR